MSSRRSPSATSKIQELKARHGIDYDTHASYRLVEPRARGADGTD